MESTQLTRELIGKPIVDIQEGQKLANVEDIYLDPVSYNPILLVTSKGGLLKKETSAISVSEVKVWGKDVILVTHPGILLPEGEFPVEREKYLSVSDQIRGRYVVDLDGTRIGQVDDVAIDINGKTKYYHLSQVFVDGEIKDTKIIPVEATRSLKDVLLIDLKNIRQQVVVENVDLEE